MKTKATQIVHHDLIAWRWNGKQIFILQFEGLDPIRLRIGSHRKIVEYLEMLADTGVQRKNYR